MFHRAPILLLLLIALWLGMGLASATAAVDYERDVKPILLEKCYSCHSVLKQEADLRLETRSLMLESDVISPGDAAASLIIERITASDGSRMPPPDEGAALTSDQIEILQTWIDDGAVAPEETAPQSPLDHWAFQPIQRPEFLDDITASHPIDALLRQSQQADSLQPQPLAPRSIQLRRLYLDLIGLPPTAQQLRDPRPWHEIVDELLASPLHGQRWARHWMDIWRYCDWYGLGQQLRYSQKHLWHWRDWIVDSINVDKGYDRMIMEMLAGDELEPDNRQVVVATGFLARNYYLFNRTTWLDSTIEHTGKAFLGLTLNCAKCHDHKYDPITQVDYYQMRAIFEPHQVRLDPLPGVVDLEQDGLARVFDDQLDIETFLHRRGDPMDPDTETPIVPAVPQLLASFAPPVQPVDLPLTAYAPILRQQVQDDYRQSSQQAVQQAKRQLKTISAEVASLDEDAEATDEKRKELTIQLAIADAKLAAANAAQQSVEATIDADVAKFKDSVADEEKSSLAKAAAIAQSRSKIAAAELQKLEQADDEKAVKAAEAAIAAASKELQSVDEAELSYVSLRPSRKALETPEHTFETYEPFYSSTSSGRRLMLARWITSSQNPLTARVAVNHVWLRHFGTPLVESVFDFGLRAERPRHAALLDFLADELIRSGWSLRHLHRLMLTSDAYRRTSSSLHADAATLAADPTNQTYWRMNSRRMESQVVRDSLLWIAGQLDVRLGGPSIDPAKRSQRRSLYFKHSRDQQDKFLEMFDDADELQCYRRQESIVPQQALALSNSKLAIEASAAIAERISDRLPDEQLENFINATFVALLGRPPEADERQQCEQYFDDLSELSSQQLQPLSRIEMRARFVHAMINHNDFVTIR